MRAVVPAVALLAVASGACNLIVGIEPWDATAASTVSSSSAGGATSTSDATSVSSTSVASTSGGEGGAPVTPRCDDQLKNGDESDVDCGGDACLPCAIDEHCGNDADCASLTCMSSTCVAYVLPECPMNPDPTMPTCADCITDGDETDIDCGGICAPCADAKACLIDADCASGACVNLSCGPPSVGCDPVDPDNPTCNDCAQGPGETDVDCGGDACGPCDDGLACLIDADCASSLCVGAVCTPAP